MTDSRQDPPQAIHAALIPVRWGDMDAMGHVNNTIYLRYAEQARIEWLQGMGVLSHESGDTAMLARVTCDFRRPILYPAQVRVELSPLGIGRTSFRIGHAIRDASDHAVLYAEGEAVMVWLGPEGRPAPVPDRLRAALSGAR